NSDPMVMNKINTWIFRDNTDIVNTWMRGQMDVKTVIQQCATATNLCPIMMEETLIQGCRNMTYISSETLPLIKTLRQQGLRIVLATDNMDVFADHTVPHMGLTGIFDDM